MNSDLAMFESKIKLALEVVRAIGTSDEAASGATRALLAETESRAGNPEAAPYSGMLPFIRKADSDVESKNLIAAAKRLQDALDILANYETGV